MIVQKLTLGLRREYWESRKMILLTVAILSVLIILAAIMANFAYRFDGHSESENVSVEQSIEAESADPVVDESHSDHDAKHGKGAAKPSAAMIEQLKLRTPFRFMSIYIGVAWLVSIFYLLSSLYSDRKDKSILYWKSLPVSETQTVLTKLLFAALGFSSIAIVVAWAVYLSLMVLGLGAFNSVSDAENWMYVGRVFDFSRLFLRPIIATLFGLIWGAPLFCYVLMISAMAKRMTLLTMIVPLFIVAALEGIFLQDSVIMAFFTSHFPFTVLEVMGDSASISEFFQYFLIEHLGSLFVGLVLSAGFTYAAVWHRNNRFEA